MDEILAFVLVAMVFGAVGIGVGSDTWESSIKKDCDNFGYVMLDDVKYSCSKVND